MFATQSRFSKVLRLLLSMFLIVMALIRQQRVSIGAQRAPALSRPLPSSLPRSNPSGARSELYLIGEKCFAVGVGVYSPFGTFALLAATFFAALSIDWVRSTLFFARFCPNDTHAHTPFTRMQ
jgi:hypothetical protein